jgi:cell division protein FtsZ
MAVGTAAGDNRAVDAAQQAISSRLLDVTIDGARGILFNVTGGPSMTLYEVNQAAEIIKGTAHPDVNLIFGAVVDENMKDEIRITVIATGFDQPTPIAIRPTAQPQVAIRPRVLEQVGAHAPAARVAAPPPHAPANAVAPVSARMIEEPAPAPAPQRPTAQKSAQPVQPELTQRPFAGSDDVDIPAFLRKRS